MRITWQQALAWRMHRHLLEPVGPGTVADVVGRLGAVPAWPEASAELAVGARRAGSPAGDVARALDARKVVKAYTFRGATHLMTVEDAGAYLALRASGRQWELPSWREFYGLEPADWPEFRAAVREALGDAPLTRDELGTALARRRRFGRAAAALTDGSDTLVKPLMWQGDVCFGPARNGQPTLQRLDAVPGWTGLPDIDDAGRRAVTAYLRTYGPAGPDRLQYWLGEGLSAGRKAIRGWLAALGDELTNLDVEGDAVLLMRDDADELAATAPTSAVRLLPGKDQWVMGPGTADPHVVPPARRAVVSGGANLVVVGGVVAGTWTVKAEQLAVTWFPEADAADRDRLADEVARLGAFLGRSLDLAEDGA